MKARRSVIAGHVPAFAWGVQRGAEPERRRPGCRAMTDACPAEPGPASSPLSLTLSQWWCVLKGVAATAERANLALISAGVAFFGLMAVVPGLAALVALVGLFSDPAVLTEQIRALGGVAPDAVISIIHQQVQRLLSERDGMLIAGAV